MLKSNDAHTAQILQELANILQAGDAFLQHQGIKADFEFITEAIKNENSRIEDLDEKKLQAKFQSNPINSKTYSKKIPENVRAFIETLRNRPLHHWLTFDQYVSNVLLSKQQQDAPGSEGEGINLDNKF